MRLLALFLLALLPDGGLSSLVLTNDPYPAATVESRNGKLAATAMRTRFAQVSNTDQLPDPCTFMNDGLIYQYRGLFTYCNGTVNKVLGGFAPGWLRIPDHVSVTSLVSPQPDYPASCKDVPMAQQTGVQWVLLQPGKLPRPVPILCDFDTPFTVYRDDNNNPVTATIRGVAIVWAGCINEESSLQNDFQNNYGNPHWVGPAIFQALTASTKRFVVFDFHSKSYLILDHGNPPALVMGSIGSRFNAARMWDPLLFAPFDADGAFTCDSTPTLLEQSNFPHSQRDRLSLTHLHTFFLHSQGLGSRPISS